MSSKRITAALAAMALSASAMTAFTAAAVKGYEPVAGGETKFDKYFVMDDGDDVPSVEFEYTIAAGTAKTYTVKGETVEVYAGIDPENIKVNGAALTGGKFKLAFSSSDATKKTAADNEFVKDLGANEKFATKTAELDFSGVQFTEPGIYRYVITESDDAQPGVSFDDKLVRYLDVYVIDATAEGEDPTLEVKTYVLHTEEEPIIETEGEEIEPATTSDGIEIPTTEDKKSQGFTNEFTSYDLVFSKKVTGNQGSKDKYFEFVLDIEGAVPGTVYTVSYNDDGNASTTDGDADETIPANPNKATTVITADVEQPATITVGPDGKAQVTFYLQHGQKIAVRGLTVGTYYTITEEQEDYTPSYSTNDPDDKTNPKANVASNVDTANTDGINRDVKVDFTNEKKGNIPTGILLSVAAPAVIALLTLGGIALLAIRNRRRNAEED